MNTIFVSVITPVLHQNFRTVFVSGSERFQYNDEKPLNDTISFEI
jgi:hypothetical protein